MFRRKAQLRMAADSVDFWKRECARYQMDRARLHNQLTQAQTELERLKSDGKETNS